MDPVAIRMPGHGPRGVAQGVAFHAVAVEETRLSRIIDPVTTVKTVPHADLGDMTSSAVRSSCTRRHVREADRVFEQRVVTIVGQELNRMAQRLAGDRTLCVQLPPTWSCISTTATRLPCFESFMLAPSPAGPVANHDDVVFCIASPRQ